MMTMEWLTELVHKVIAHCGRDELVSLGLVNCGAAEGTTNSRPIGLTQVSPREHIAHPHNATGSFYSEDDGFRRVVVAILDGSIREIFYHPHQGIFLR